jgi:hypothetical protein
MMFQRRRPIVDQRTFLSFDEEELIRADLEGAYMREGFWRQEQSLLSLAKWLAMPKPPRPAWRSQQVRLSMVATSLLERAATMRRHQRLTARMIWRHYAEA